MISLILRHWRPLASALVMAIIIGAVLMYGSNKYDQGVSYERAKNAAAAIDAGRSRAEVDQAVGRLPDGAAADELRKHWSRD